MSWTVPQGCYYIYLEWVQSPSHNIPHKYSAGQVVPDAYKPKYVTAQQPSQRWLLVDFDNGYIYGQDWKPDGFTYDNQQPFYIIDNENKTISYNTLCDGHSWGGSYASNTILVAASDMSPAITNRFWDSETGDYKYYYKVQTNGFIFGDGTGILAKSSFGVGSGTVYNCDNAFAGRTDITRAVLPSGVDKARACFENCISLETAVIQDGIQNLSDCFSGCTSLTNARLPNQLVGEDNDMRRCFKGCTSLVIAPDMPLEAADMESCFNGCSSLIEAPDIPNGVTNINSCFSDCTSLTTAPDIPSSVISMTSCFNNCTSLATPPDMLNASSVTSMYNCFCDCTSLTSAPSIPSSVINMNRCFYNCTLLTSAPSIPANVTDMNRCFFRCMSLTTPPDMSNATSVTDMTGCFMSCISLTTAPKIPSSVTSLASCFSSCSSLTTMPEIETPSNIWTMAGCFDGCVSLTTASTIPASVSNIVDCFNYCINLTGTIEINSTTLISSDVFRDTTKLIVLKGAYPQLSTIADQYSNVYVYSLSDTIAGERNDDILNLVTLSVQVNRFKAGSNDDVLSAINIYKNNNSSALLGLEWFTDDVADPQPDSTTWNQGEGWYLRDGNAPNYIFVEQNNKQLDTTKTYYKALESFIMDESPKIFYTNIDSVSEDETTTFNIIVTDAYGEAATQYLTIPIAFYTMDVVKGGRVISFGQHATQDMLYKLLEAAPTDWLTDYNNYYQKDIYGNYIQLNEITAPSFETDTYYQLEYPDGLFNCRMGAKFVDMIVTNLIGEIKIYAGATIPDGWLVCDGRVLDIEEYPLLFNAIGNTYGGDGITTFCLPDLVDRFPVGAGNLYSLNSKDGSKDAVVVTHQHEPNDWIVVANRNYVSAGDKISNASTGSFSSKSKATQNADLYVSKAPTNAVSGTDKNMPPYIGVQYIIRAI